MFRGVKCISCSSMPNCQVAVCHMLTAGFFQRTWTVTGLSRRGREESISKFFFLGVVPGVYQAEAGDAHFHLLGFQGGSPAREMDISGVWFFTTVLAAG